MKTILKYYIRLMTLVLPISFLPVVVDSFGVGRNWILMVGAIVGLVLFTATLLLEKEKTVRTSGLMWFMVALVTFGWVSWWLRLLPGVKMRSVVDFGGIGTLTAWLAWLFLWLQTEDDRKSQVKWLTVAGAIAGVASLFVFLFPASRLPIVWPKDNPIVNISSNWSLTGSLLNEVILMAFLVAEWVKRLVKKLKKEEGYVVEAIITSMLTLVMLLDGFRLFREGWLNMDNGMSWVIAAEAFKRSPIWGVGVGNFVEAFWLWRPVTYNLTKYWASGFRFASTGVFNLWTEMGVVGLGLGVLMALRVWKEKKNFDGVRAILMGLLAVFLPYNFVTLWIMMWLMAGMGGKNHQLEMGVTMGEKKVNVAPWIVGVVFVGVSVFSGMWMYRIVRGEMYMRQSLLAASKNDGGGTYNLQIKAIGMMPTLAEYRRVYSQTNLSLASVILANKEMTDEDKQKASVLVQQAVREGKAAISLEESNPSYWINLAAIYRQIVGVVDGAADWSYQAYQQAVAIEPVNPMSRLDMGGLLFAAGKYDEADRAFEAVIMSKNDLANGWYNWAHTAKKLNKLPEAVGRLTQAIALVPVDSGDYEQASKELTEWKKELEVLTKKQAEQVSKPAETLETPKPLPTGSTGVIPVPSGADLNPPSVSPIPTAKVSVTPSVSPTSGPTVAPKTP